MAPELRDDEAARSLIRSHLTATMLVEAGAGTGKTSVLVDRVVSLVLNGTPIEKIAAITFTEKAATELRDRVRTGLEQAQSQRPDGSALINVALGSLERAQLSTIHAFCQSLLRGFAAQAGIDPSFFVSDEVKAERRRQERWRLYLDDLAQDEKASAVVHRALGLGMTPEDLETVASELAERAELVAVLDARPFVVPIPMWPSIEEMERKLAGLRVQDEPTDDRLRLSVEKIVSLVRDLRAADMGDRETVLASAAGLLDKGLQVGRREDWGERISDVRETAKEVCARLKDMLVACRQEALAELMPIVVHFVKRETVERGRDGELTFGDLILRTRDLLQSDAGAVAALRERYDALLIDEFQDTDPLQVDIALAFGRDPATGKLEAGRLFLVGDPKQSIYRFRRADMGMYWQTRTLVEDEGGDFPALSRNRRSRPVIVSWVNSVFGRMIGPGENPGIQPPYRPIVEDRTEVLNGPGAGYFGAGVGEGPNAREIRQMEAAEAAELSATAVHTRWEVWDAATGTVRPAQYRDIAFLMPSRAGLLALEQSLANAGVPYRVEGGSLVYRTQEVRDLINCLAAINDPTDEVAVVAALRSPAFACSDVDLAKHKAAGGAFNYQRDVSDAGEPRVRGCLKSLATYHDKRHSSSLATLVERFVADRGMVETGVLDRGDRNSFRRMRFIAEQARAFESAGPESLREFVSWLEGCGKKDFLDNEGAGLDDDEDAVRILTIHGAKGLEFPIVILVGMSTSPRNNPGNYLADHATGRVALKMGAGQRRFDVGPYEELNTNERAYSEAEFARTLYVAATRARDHLLFSLYRGSRGASSAAARLEANGATDLAERVAPVSPATTALVGPLDGLSVEEPQQATVEAFEVARQQLVAGARKKLFTSATAEVRETEAPGSRKEDNGDEGEPWARGRGGTRLGRAVHAAIQSLPLDADDSAISAFASAQAVAEAIPQRAALVARLVRRALDSEAAERARRAQRALREVPFAVQAGDVTLEGFIDLLIETAEGLEIVDWKTDQISDEQVETRLEDYRLQAGLYVWGLQEATGRRVNRVTYVFASPGREVSPGDPAELAESARRHLSSRTAAPLRGRPGSTGRR